MLDAIEDERLVDHVARLGEALTIGLERVRDLGIAEVRGRGLIVGVELVGSALAERVGSDVRADGILIGRTGCRENVLKIRPPVIFDAEQVRKLSDAITTTVASVLPATN